MACAGWRSERKGIACSPKNDSTDEFDVPLMLENVTCPTLMLYGEVENGAVVRDRDVEFFLDHVPKGTAIQIKNAGHLLQTDQPARVLEHIEEFLENL
jgi:pimeloyl-ACP methyl ester carboxylesterase